MAWTIEYARGVQKQLAKLDRTTANRLVDFLERRIATGPDPRSSGQALAGPLSPFWRYRVGDYRILCEIKDDFLVVLVLKVGHRGDVYR